MNATHGTLDIPDDPTPWFVAVPNDTKEFCVLMLQGWNSTIAKHEDRIKRLAKITGITFATIDYAGHGNHPVPRGESTREQQLNEALAAYDTLKAMGFKDIIVAGTSFGGYMSALLSARRDPYAIILRVPAIYNDDEFTIPQTKRQSFLDEAYQKFKPTVSSSDNLAALNAIKNFDGSVYVIEQELDSVIPKNIPMSYFEVAKRGSYLVIPATEHSPAMQTGIEERYAAIEHLTASIVTAIMLEKKIFETQDAKLSSK